jgi:hypothetical protein
MAYKETFWMACDSTEQMRAEYGPFHTPAPRRRGKPASWASIICSATSLFDERNEIQEVRSIFIEFEEPVRPQRLPIKLHTRCATCGEAATHDESWQAEVWADIHEFEHSRHFVRLFEQVRSKLKEIAKWRETA